jgi:hypothetical protein
MLALYFLQPVGSDFSQRGQQGSVARRHGGRDKPLAKAIHGEMLLKPLKISGSGWLLLFVRHWPISQNANRIRDATGKLQPHNAARNARIGSLNAS